MSPKLASSELIDFEVPYEALRLWEFSGNNPSYDKYELTSVLFEPERPSGKGPSIIHAVATNGARLIHVWWKMQKGDKLPRPLHVTSESVKFLLNHFGESAGARLYRILEDPTEGLLLGTDRKEFGELVAVEPKYPDWREVFHEAESDTCDRPVSFAVDLDLVYDFQFYLKEFAKPQTAVKINYPEPPNGPMKIIPYGTKAGGDGAMNDGLYAEYVLAPVL